MIMPILSGFLDFITPYLVKRKRMAPKAAEMQGAMAQAANTWETPPQDQSTPSAPTVAKPTPMIPPMMQWVVETGRPILVAKVKKREEPMSAQSMPIMRTLGASMKASVEMMSFLMVPETRDLLK
jgi:hypothetical protein